MVKLESSISTAILTSRELHDEPDGVYLISLNQKYRPIQVLESDSFKIFGKVIGKCKGAEIPGFH